MWPLSPAAQAALRAPLQPIQSRVTAYTADHGTVPPDLLPIKNDGKVSMTGSAGIRSSLALTFAQPSLWPIDPRGVLSPFSTELFVERGIVCSDGTTEWVPMGVFGIQTVNRTGAGRTGIAVAGKDRAAAIGRNRFDVNTQAPVGAGVIETMTAYVRTTFPDITVLDLTDGVAATVTKADFQRDKLGALSKLATSASVKGYFDRLGNYVIRRLPTLDDDPVWTVDAGPRGVLIDSSEEASSVDAFNRFRASGVTTTSTTDSGAEAPPPPSAVVVDDDPESPFYIGQWDGTRWVGGRMLPASRFYASPLLTTEAQCLAVAQDLREKVRGRGYTADFSAVPNPALDADDVFAARAGYRSARETRHLIDSIEHNLSAAGGPQMLATRGESLPDEETQEAM